MKQRLDICVIEKRGFSRTYAREAIEAGLVQVNGKTVTRPGNMVLCDTVTVLAPDMPYVSRGGYKLAAAFEAFDIDLSGLVCLDVGASTGGFTDCMLKQKARLVYAVDVGKEQFTQSLKDDCRVILYESVDVRNVNLPETVDFAACDVSFISVAKILPSLRELIKPGGGFVCLIKPQFETEGRHLNKKGVVKEKSARKSAVQRVLTALRENGFAVNGVIESPITGRDGNVEFLAYSNVMLRNVITLEY